MSGPIDSVQRAYGEGAPDWLIVLARTCEATSQSATARNLGYTPAVISQVLNNRYGGNLDNVQTRVTGKLMGATLECPALGNLPLHECQAWRKKSRNFSGANHQRVMMYRACNRCPNNRPEVKK